MNENLEKKLEGQGNEYPLCEYSDYRRKYIEESYPVAEVIVNLLKSKNFSYAKAYEALDIAKEGLKTLIVR